MGFLAGSQESAECERARRGILHQPGEVRSSPGSRRPGEGRAARLLPSPSRSGESLGVYGRCPPPVWGLQEDEGSALCLDAVCWGWARSVSLVAVLNGRGAPLSLRSLAGHTCPRGCEGHRDAAWVTPSTLSQSQRWGPARSSPCQGRVAVCHGRVMPRVVVGRCRAPWRGDAAWLCAVARSGRRATAFSCWGPVWGATPQGHVRTHCHGAVPLESL